MSEHGWTRHGHRCCDQATGPRPAGGVAKCGGPALCRNCAADAAIRHSPGSGTFAAPTSPSEPAPLRMKTPYTVPGLDGTWRIRGLETTNMAADGTAKLFITREDVVPAPLIGADDADTPQHVTGVTELEPVPSIPRVWAMPEIPKDVKTLRDNEGVEWRRVEKPYPLTWEDVHGNWRQERSLLLDVGPLTEVEETNDAN